ncbi:MAG: thioesterase family protein [Cyanobacteria bacterium P01_D01_bin.1]
MTQLKWFEYPVRVQPHHTDYGGVVWHGTYITWLESARIECLRSAGVPFEHLVNLGYDLPVVALDIRYKQPLTLGMAAVVKTRLAPMKGLRLNWLYEVVADAADASASREVSTQVYLSAQVTLVTVGMRDRKIVRHLPAAVTEVLGQIHSYFR